MCKFKIGTLGLFLAALFLAGTFTVSCLLLASSDAAITKDIKAKILSKKTSRHDFVTARGEKSQISMYWTTQRLAPRSP